eukprot:1185700-Prorocentrum_minimum.AAC.1
MLKGLLALKKKEEAAEAAAAGGEAKPEEPPKPNPDAVWVEGFTLVMMKLGRDARYKAIKPKLNTTSASVVRFERTNEGGR